MHVINIELPIYIDDNLSLQEEYRIYINNELMAEKTITWNIKDEFIKEYFYLKQISEIDINIEHTNYNKYRHSYLILNCIKINDQVKKIVSKTKLLDPRQKFCISNKFKIAV